MTDPDASLWRATAPEPPAAQPLDGDTTADVAIVGAGYTGCAAALALAEAGADAVLLEARSIGHGGSGRNVGLVNAGLWTPPDDVEALLGPEAGGRLNAALAAAPETVYALIERLDIPCEAVRHGTLHLAHAPSGLKDLRRRLAQQQARQAPVSLLDAAETARRTGTDRFHGALLDLRAGTVQPLAYAVGLARAAVAAGARIHANTPVSGRRHDGAAWRLDTPGGAVTARVLIDATNAYGAVNPRSPDHTPVHFF
ncbi:MAG: FAD-binding oxidoreductase, partial [Rhodobacterales bacterium]|nr:FAD-binding oxidoreductase [Rhodobacterales bacterium]